MSKLTGKVAAVQNGRVAVTFLGRSAATAVAMWPALTALSLRTWWTEISPSGPKDAERALQPNKDDDAHDTDIG